MSIFGNKGFCRSLFYSEIWSILWILTKFDAHFLKNDRNFCENGRNFCRNFEISVDPIFVRPEKNFQISSTYRTRITGGGRSVNHLSAEHRIKFSTFFVKNWNLKSGLYCGFARISKNSMTFFNKKLENSWKKIKIEKIKKTILNVALAMIWKKKNFYHQNNILLCEKKNKS